MMKRLIYTHIKYILDHLRLEGQNTTTNNNNNN